jgi:hypothetical protein
MELPVRISRERPREPVISVDGAWDAPGLNLSHWPGHRTPPELRHDLSTGVGLAYARLPDARRRELARGCVAIVNNHYDTDGTCALFAVRHPRRALELERELCDAARAGDLFAMPSERAFCVDRIVTHLVDGARSPIAGRLAGLEGAARHEAATQVLLEELPAILRGDLEPYRELFEEELETTRRDLAELGRAQRDDVVHLDWTVWVPRTESFGERRDPGRHALFGSTQSDRVLIALQGGGGTRYRLLFNTTSWFDLVTRAPLPRPDLAGLTQRLNELEGTAEADEAAWRAEDPATPSPELWFGTTAHEMFEERSGACLRPSRLAVPLVRRVIADALRSVLVLP